MNQGHVDNLPELGHHCLSLKLNEGGGNKIVFKKKIAVFFYNRRIPHRNGSSYECLAGMFL